MKLRNLSATAIAVLAGAALSTSSLEARTCSGDGLVIGTYAYSASRSGFFLLNATAAAAGSPAGSGPLIPVSITPPGSNTTTTGTGTSATAFTASSTSIGSLIAGLNNPSVFSGIGLISADGNGNLFASPGIGLPANVPAGTYNVNLDCSVTLTLYDPFTPGTGTAATGITTTTTTTTATGAPTIVTSIIGATQSGLKAGAVNLQGELVNNGGEIDLAVAGVNGAGVTVKMTKNSQVNSCTNASLVGNFAISANGFGLPSAGTGLVSTGTTVGSTATGTGVGMVGTTTGTTTSALPAPATTCTTAASGVITTTTIINGTTTTGSATNCIIPEAGAFLAGPTGTFGTPFNLLGRFVADGNGNLASDTAAVQSPLTSSLSGTYTVNADCTGTAKLIDQSSIGRGINFVLTNNSGLCSAGSNAQNGCIQQLQFVFSDPGVFGSGTATQQ